MTASPSGSRSLLKDAAFIYFIGKLFICLRFPDAYGGRCCIMHGDGIFTSRYARTSMFRRQRRLVFALLEREKFLSEHQCIIIETAARLEDRANHVHDHECLSMLPGDAEFRFPISRRRRLGALTTFYLSSVVR